MIGDEQGSDPVVLLAELNVLDKKIAGDAANVDLLRQRAVVRRKLATIEGKTEFACRALEDLQLACQLRPNDPSIYLEMGLTHHIARFFDEAIVDYSKSIVLRESSLAYYNRGVSRWEKTKLEYGSELAGKSAAREAASEALTDYERALDFDPTIRDAHLNRAVILICLRSWQAAIEELNQSLKIDPTDILSYFNRALCWENVAQPRYSDKRYLQMAISDYSTVVRINPDYIPAYFNRALCYEWLGPKRRYENRIGTEQAVSDYRAILARHPDESRARLNLAWALEHMGEIQQAVQEFEQFLNKREEYQVEIDAFALGQIEGHVLFLRKMTT